MHEPDRTQRYEIRVRGLLGSRGASWFPELAASPEAGEVTRLVGCFPDQAALHGLLRRIADLGLPLLSVTQLLPEEPPASTNHLRSSGDPT